MLLSQLLVVAAVSCVPGLVSVPLPPCLHVATTPALGLPGSQVSSFFLSIFFLEVSLRNLRLDFYLFVMYLFLAVWCVESWFPDLGSNLCPLPWKCRVFPLDHQGSSLFLLQGHLSLG